MRPGSAAPLLAGVLVAAQSLGVGHAGGDEPALSADRPGFGESASSVPPRHVQLELGAAWTRVDAATSQVDGPELLSRIGLLEWLELRLLTPNWIETRSAARRTRGWADTSLGLKGHLASTAHDLSLRASVYLPSGSSGISSERVDPEVALAWSHPLSEAWTIAATLSQRWSRLQNQTATSPSLSLSRDIGAHLGTFVEYGATLGDGVRPLHRLDHGYTWTLGRTQLDVSAGIALSPAAPDFFVGAGLAQLF